MFYSKSLWGAGGVSQKLSPQAAQPPEGASISNRRRRMRSIKEPHEKQLTRREFEIYMLICTRAYSHKQLAAILNCKIDALKFHIKHIYDKMLVGSKLELLVQYHKRENP